MRETNRIDNLDLVGQSLDDASEDFSLFEREVQALDADHPRISQSQEEYEAALRGRELQQVDDIIQARKTYANQVFKLVSVWLAMVAAIIIAEGFGTSINFSLSDKVLITLIGGTTLNVIGIFTIVANFLFPKSGHSFFFRRRAKKIASEVKSEPAQPAVD